jgi:hypothetical protein
MKIRTHGKEGLSPGIHAGFCNGAHMAIQSQLTMALGGMRLLAGYGFDAVAPC